VILVDSSVWIDFYRGRVNPESLRLRAMLQNCEDIAVCGTILTEVVSGLPNGDGDRMRKDLLRLPCLATDKVDFVLAADIYRAARHSGKTPGGTADCLIAAVAIRHQAILLHRDRGFTAINKLFPRLKIPVITH